MYINFSELNPQNSYALITQTIIPRPIAWVLTKNQKKNNYNLAPFSYFNAVCSKPPYVVISMSKKTNNTSKDTARNLKNKGTPFVLHIASTKNLQNLNQSATEISYGESEVEKFNIPLTEWEFSIPRLQDVMIAFACKSWKRIPIEKSEQFLLLAKLESIYIDDKITEKDTKDRLKINAKKINPLIRLGFGEYAMLGKVFNILRP